MDMIHGYLRTKVGTTCISRRAALRSLGGAGVAVALTVAAPGRVGADEGDRIGNALFPASSGIDPAAVIEAYVAAVNTGDLEGILARYDDQAVHIALPTPDGSAGVCQGKDQLRRWYAQSVANGERLQVEDGTLAVDGNQAAFVTRLTSDPWTALGLEALEAHAEMVLFDGRIMTHVVVLSPESVRQLQAARGTPPQQNGLWAAPPERRMPGQPY